MAARLMGDVLARGPVERGPRQVLLALANHAHEDGSEARPGLNVLCAELLMSRSTVLGHLAWLQDEGWIVRDRPPAGGRDGSGRFTVWRVVPDRLTGPSTRTRLSETGPTTRTRLSGNGSRKPNKRVQKTEQTGSENRSDTIYQPSRTLREPSARTRAKNADATVEAVPLEPVAPLGAGRDPLTVGEDLDRLIAEVSERRGRKLTRSEAVAARKLAREHAAVGTDRRVVLAGLVATRAFTSPALTYAIERLRDQVLADLTPFERLKARGGLP